MTNPITVTEMIIINNIYSYAKSIVLYNILIQINLTEKQAKVAFEYTNQRPVGKNPRVS
jgi:hypothetical protein